MTHRIFDPTPRITHRPIAELAADLSALRAVAQAAINVELFTIPLYMGTLYSIQGMHEINAAGQTFYKGRLWPGAATSRAPKTANERAFNVVFSVFVQEMLHLQLAANLAACLGVQPDFTSKALQDEKHGWTCYGPEEHVIPHILDLRDTTTYAELAVDIAPLDEAQIRGLQGHRGAGARRRGPHPAGEARPLLPRGALRRLDAQHGGGRSPPLRDHRVHVPVHGRVHADHL